jgi:hypothetical protein
VRIILAMAITFESDGSLASRPLGYTVRDAQGGSWPTPDELEELKRKILARATAGPPQTRVEPMAQTPPHTKPERPPQQPIVPRAAASSIQSAERALAALGFDADAAATAVIRHGARRVSSVAEWARKRMTQGDVKDPVKLIESCLARPQDER